MFTLVFFIVFKMHLSKCIYPTWMVKSWLWVLRICTFFNLMAIFFFLGTLFNSITIYSCFEPVFSCWICCCWESTVCSEHGILYFGSPWMAENFKEKVNQNVSLFNSYWMYNCGTQKLFQSVFKFCHTLIPFVFFILLVSFIYNSN